MASLTTGRSGTLSQVALRVRGFATFMEQWIAPLNDLAIRVILFRVFFWSGLTKLDDWEGTLMLFQYEYQVPVLPYAVTAVIATTTELVAASAVLVGFLARLAALPMLAMALVIQFVLGAANPAYDNLEHFMWMVLLLSIILRGPGKISIDHLMAMRFGGERV